MVVMFRIAPTVTDVIAENLSRNQTYFTSASGVVKQYRRWGEPTPIAFLIEGDDIVAYMLFNILTYDKARDLMLGWGSDSNPPQGFSRFFYIDTIDVAKPFQGRGIGSDFVRYALSQRLPIILQCTEDSESYWEDMGFEYIDESWMWREN